jgi:diacylglycerol kinase family enzyme
MQQWDPLEENGLESRPWQEIDYHLTTDPEGDTMLARLSLHEGAELVVCVGGDGTLNEDS